jgi:ubiquitin-protein ligase
MEPKQPLKNIKRIMKDYGSLMEEGPKYGIFPKVIDDDVSKIFVMLVGPDDSPYEGSFLFFTIEPGTQYTPVGNGRQYPAEPPKVLFHSPFSIRCHPNLYQSHGGGGGKVCLSILGTWAGEGWSVLMTFMIIMQTILGILDNHPLCNEPGYYGRPKDPNVATYTKYVRYVCIRETIDRMIVPIANNEQLNHPFAHMFAAEMKEWFVRHREKYINRLLKLADEFDGKSKIEHSVCYGNSSYSGGEYNYRNLAEKLMKL